MLLLKYILKKMSNLFQTVEIGATDADEGANAIVSFSLHGETAEFFFFFSVLKVHSSCSYYQIVAEAMNQKHIFRFHQVLDQRIS